MKLRIDRCGRAVGLEKEAWPELWPGIANVSQRSDAAVRTMRQMPFVQEHWRSGDSVVWPVFTAEPDRNESWGDALICFCGGAQACKSVESSMSSLPAVNYSLQLNEQPSASYLPTVTSRQETPWQVTVIFGILPIESGLLELFPRSSGQGTWKFDDMFDPSDPWAQRAVLHMSSRMPTTLRAQFEDLGGLWIHAFEKWLLQLGEEYPSRYFLRRLNQFLELSGAYQKDLLLQGELVKAVRLGFVIDAPAGGLSVDELSTLHQEWSRYVKVRNSNATIKANQAWHVSPAWEDLAASKGIESSISWSLGLTALLGAGFTVLQLRSITLTCIVLISMTSAVLLQCAVFVGTFSWKLGPVEALALILYAGYLLDLHIRLALAYLSASAAPVDMEAAASTNAPGNGRETADAGKPTARDDRQHRMRHALRESIELLLSCLVSGIMIGMVMTIPYGLVTVRGKMGSSLMSFVVIAGLHTMLLMPALLCLLGPTPVVLNLEDKCKRRIGRCLSEVARTNHGEAVQPAPSAAQAVKAKAAPINMFRRPRLTRG